MYYFTNVINTLAFAKLAEHRVFKVAYRFEDLANDATAYMHFSMPSLAVVASIITSVEIVTQGQGNVDISDSFTVSSAGTSVTPLNLFIGSSFSPTASVKRGGTYSDITNKLSYVVPGGTSVRAIGSTNVMGEFIMVPPGEELLIQFTNTSGNANDCSISIVWIEAA